MTNPAGGEGDHLLIARTRMGDSAAYDELYRRHVDDAARAARVVAWDADAANNLVAVAFSRVRTIIRRGGGPDDDFGPYVRAMVRRLALDRLRRLRHDDSLDPSLFDDLPHADDPVGPATDRHLVRQAFETLPERWQQVLWRTEVEARTPASLVPGLGAAPNAVAALAFRAREGLRQAYLAVSLSAHVLPECRAFSPNIPAYVRGTLSAHDTREMSAHLAWCPHCRERRDELLLLVSDLPDVLGSALLLPGSTATAGGLSGGTLAFLAPSSWGRRQLVGSSAAVVVAGLIGVSAFLFADEPMQTPSSAPTVSYDTSRWTVDPGTTSSPAAGSSTEPPGSSQSYPPSSDRRPKHPDTSPLPWTAPDPGREPGPRSPEPESGTDADNSPADPAVPEQPSPDEQQHRSPSPTPTPLPPSTTPADDSPPAIEEQPPAHPVAAAGEPLTLTVEVTGNPAPELQWQYADPVAGLSTTGGTETAGSEPGGQSVGAESVWIDIPGETSNTLVIPEPTPEHHGRAYRLKATNPLATVTTAAAVLSVRYAPEITVQPDDVQVDACPAGEPAENCGQATLRAAATANPEQVTTAWQHRKPGGLWTDLPRSASSSDGATAILTLVGVGSDRDGYEYRAVFSNALGTTSSRAVTMTVRWAPTVTEQPADAYARPGDDIVLRARSSANPAASWHWETAPNTDAEWLRVPGSHGEPGSIATLAIPSVTAEHDGARYRAVFTNALGSVTTDPAQLTVAELTLKK